MKKYLIVFIGIIFSVLSGVSAPMKSMEGAKWNPLIEETEDSPTYIQEGLLYWWDGIKGLVENYRWYDIVNNKYIVNVVPGDGPFITYRNLGGQINCSSTGLYCPEEFTIHSLIETVKGRFWGNWSMVGLGRGSGLHNGIILADSSTPFSVQYHKVYSGAVLNQVNLSKVKYGDTIVLDIVFRRSTLVYEVYVNGEFVGSSQIAEENWNLDGATLALGASFYGRHDNNSNFKMYNLLYYERALSAEEVAYNFTIDSARFNLP